MKGGGGGVLSKVPHGSSHQNDCLSGTNFKRFFFFFFFFGGGGVITGVRPMGLRGAAAPLEFFK